MDQYPSSADFLSSATSHAYDLWMGTYSGKSHYFIKSTILSNQSPYFCLDGLVTCPDSCDTEEDFKFDWLVDHFMSLIC